MHATATPIPAAAARPPAAVSSAALVQALRAVLPGEGSAPLHAPEFAGNEWAYVKDCLDTGWVSSVGSYVDAFERQLAAATGAAHAVVTVNGTAALHIALLLAGAGPGCEVLVPALSFVATANAVVHAGAVPHFVDSEDRTLGIDPAALRAHLSAIGERRGGATFNRRSGRRIAALVPMHVFGHPADLDGLLAVAQDFGIPLVEDAAESLGSWYGERHTGTLGRCAALSFNGNKIITTGGGGAILTDDATLAARAKHLTTTAKRPHAWAFEHDEVAWNYRMPNLNAALGCAQLERLPDLLARKRALAARYRSALAGLPGLHFVDEPAGCRSNFWLNAFRLDRPDAARRDALLVALNTAGWTSRPAWALLDTLPMYCNVPAAPLPVARRLADALVNLPSSAALGGPAAA